MLSTRTCRTAVRAAASSLTSTTFRTVRRLTMASAIRAAISSRRGIPLEPTRPRRGESRNRSEEHTSELQSRGHLVCRLLLEKKKKKITKKDKDTKKKMQIK